MQIRLQQLHLNHLDRHLLTRLLVHSLVNLTAKALSNLVMEIVGIVLYDLFTIFGLVRRRVVGGFCETVLLVSGIGVVSGDGGYQIGSWIVHSVKLAVK